MNQQEAREYIRFICQMQQIGHYPAVHPEIARKLYTAAGLSIPKHLNPQPPITEAFAYEIWKKVSEI